MTTDKYYITTTAPYVNGKPHIGFALEIVQADSIARFKRLQGYDVFFNFGTDEHGQKIYKGALAEGKDPQDYADEYASEFEKLKKSLNLSYDKYTRTTNPEHKKAAQHIWKLCLQNGFIEKGVYDSKYCVGCELEKQDSELENERCPLHPTLEIEHLKEENYFFKFSRLQEKLLALYNNNPEFVVPQHRLSEIKNFVADGLKDFSISRLKEKMPWGVPVPDDDKHVMYVWFDALTYYISALGWPTDETNFTKFWGTLDHPNAIQVAGKDNLRQQSAMWQAMLLAAGLPTSKQILIHGFISSGGQRMSKTQGNVIDPIEYASKYGTDALRYYLLAKVSPTEDSDFTTESFEQAYQADLANGLGNLVSRILGLVEKPKTIEDYRLGRKFSKNIIHYLDKYELNKALENIWSRISLLDKYINEHKIWERAKNDREVHAQYLYHQLGIITHDLKPFLPQTAEKIESQVKSGKSTPIFPRLDTIQAL